MRSKAAIEREHFDSHYRTTKFDYYCVAHEDEYQPKYLQLLGEICHDYYDGYCADSCNRCPVRCPVQPCPIEED